MIENLKSEIYCSNLGEKVTALLTHHRQSPQIRQSTAYYAGLIRRWDKRIVDQASDVPSIIFFHDFLLNSLQKYFQSICLFFLKKYKNKSKEF